MTGKTPSTPAQRQAFGLRIPRASDAQLRALRATHQPTHQGWPCGVPRDCCWTISKLRNLPADSVPDIGCGWGLAGVYCASRGASVLSCDIDPEVLPIAQYHARLNDVEIVTEARGFDSVQGAML